MVSEKIKLNCLDGKDLRAPVHRSVNFDNLVVRHIASRYVEVKRKAPAFPIRTKQKRHKKSLPLVFTTRGL